MNTAKKIDLFVGLTTQGGVILKTNETKSRISDLFNTIGIQAYSLNTIEGVWKSQPEVTINISIVDTDFKGERHYQKIASDLSQQFNQECVLLTVSDIQYAFCS